MLVLKILTLAVRAPIAFVWTLLIHIFVVRLVQLFNGGRRVPGGIKFWGRGLAWIMGVRVHKINERSGPYGDLIIANHMGFLDVPILLCIYPSVFIIKMEARRYFYFGSALEKQGHIFVDRKSKESASKASADLAKLFDEGDRIIVFPEGGASPGAERKRFKPGSFRVAKELDKTVEVCVLDYLPDRTLLKWDVNKGMPRQLVDLFGRRRIDVSVEFFPPEKVEGDPVAYANKWHDIVQSKLEQYDKDAGR